MEGEGSKGKGGVVPGWWAGFGGAKLSAGYKYRGLSQGDVSLKTISGLARIKGAGDKLRLPLGGHYNDTGTERAFYWIEWVSGFLDWHC